MKSVMLNLRATCSRRIQIDADDLASTHHPRTLDHVQADTAKPVHHHIRAGHQATPLRAANQLAQIGLARAAGLALAAFRRVQRHNMITFFEGCHARARVNHHTGNRVPQNGREDTCRVGAGEGVTVGVANASRLDFDQLFASAGAFQINRFDG